MQRWLAAAAAACALAGCSATRLAYDHADIAARFMASDYFDLDSAQSEEMKARIARLHQWHRANELPVYAALMRSASERVAQGLTAEDVAWAIASVRSRYRRLAAKAAEDTAPVLATLGPAQLARLEHRLAESDEKYAKEFLPRDQKERERAQLKRAVERFRDFIGPLTSDQEARVDRFVKSQERHAVLRFEDRQHWQSGAIGLIRQHRDPHELGQRLAELFTQPDSRRSEEFVREDRRWEEDVAQLIVDLDRTLTREQRARAVKRMQGYAEDFTLLAARKSEAT